VQQNKPQKFKIIFKQLLCDKFYKHFFYLNSFTATVYVTKFNQLLADIFLSVFKAQLQSNFIKLKVYVIVLKLFIFKEQSSAALFFQSISGRQFTLYSKSSIDKKSCLKFKAVMTQATSLFILAFSSTLYVQFKNT